MEITERAVSYFSEGDRIAAVVYTAPGGPARKPAIVLCHGFTAIKEVILPDYARAFAEAGFVAVAFDYRGFGESGGAPGRLIARRQIEDIRNSVTFARSLPEVDAERVGLWGTSYGAGNVIVAAAEDPRVRCVTAQVGFSDGGRRMRERPAEETAPMRAMIEAERTKRVLTNEPTMVEPLQLLSDPETVGFFSEARKQHPRLSQPISMEFIEATQAHRPIVSAAELTCPLLLIAAELDSVTPAKDSEDLFEAAPEPKKLVILPGVRHYEIYSGEPLRRSSAEAVAWFSQHLTPGS
jgi:dipeptidyl aminopeptidase/acylaminoacyl peptidase